MTNLPEAIIVNLNHDTRKNRIVVSGVDELVTCKRCKHYVDYYGYCDKYERGGFIPSDYCSKSSEKE